MRKIFKKVVTAVASLAMMAGLVAGMPTMDAKAGAEDANPDIKTKLVVYLSGFDNVGKVYLDDCGEPYTANVSSNATKSALLNYGHDGYEFTKVSDGKYEIEVIGECQNESWVNFQIVVAPTTGDTQLFGGKFNLSYYDGAAEKLQNAKDFNEHDTIYFSINENTDQWQNLSHSFTDPTAITAAQVIEKINAIGTVEYTDESLAKIEAAEAAKASYTGNEADITNLATLTAARTKYNELKAAAEAAAAGKLVIYVKNSENWSAMKLYSWKDSTKFFGDWPGKDMTACTKNEGWYSAQFDITAATSLIFNNGEGKQSENIEDVSAGTYWFTLALNENNQLVATASTTAPQGWVDEAAAEIKPVTPGDTNNTNNNTNNATTPSTGDATPVAAAVAAVVLMGLAVVVLNTKKANR